MRRRRNTLPVIAFSTSLMIHATLLIALPYAIEAATPQDQARNRDAEHESQVMILPVEVALGIDAPTPETPTWIGFAEPEQQRAEKAEIEQAAFTVEPVAAAPISAALPVESSIPPPPATQPQPEPQPVSAAERFAQRREPPEPQPLELPRELPPPSLEEFVGQVPLVDDAMLNTSPSSPSPNQEQAELVADAIERVKQLLREIQKAVEQQSSESPSTSESTPSAAGAVGEQSPQSPPSPPQAQPSSQVQPGPPAEQTPTEVGSPADKESSPTSLIDIPPDQWHLGKPLAREGLTLKPRRPEFTLLVTLTASPGNPLVRINFGRDGVPVAASLLRSSGDKRVDDAILASLYRWRAEGKDLETLAPGKTLDVRMRIVLNRRSTE